MAVNPSRFIDKYLQVRSVLVDGNYRWIEPLADSSRVNRRVLRDILCCANRIYGWNRGGNIPDRLGDIWRSPLASVETNQKIEKIKIEKIVRVIEIVRKMGEGVFHYIADNEEVILDWSWLTARLTGDAMSTNEIDVNLRNSRDAILFDGRVC